MAGELYYFGAGLSGWRYNGGMGLENIDLKEVKARLADAWKAERADLEQLRLLARELKDGGRKLGRQQASAVAFVAADGGDNRIRLNAAPDGAPAIVELVRVVDSNGRECALDAVAGAVDDDFFSEPRGEAMRVLCDDLGVSRVDDLSSYLSAPKISRSDQMRAYRDIVEWAVLYHLLVKREWGSDTLLVREGALRTRVFRADIFNAMDKNIRAACERHRKQDGVDMFFVGVAKSTVLLDRLRFALSLEGVFERDDPWRVHVRRDIAEKFYDRRWLDTLETAGGQEYLSMAEMFLVKFGDHSLDPVWPVDVAAWQKDRAEKILGCLAEDARPGFPIPDFPMCIQKAHDHARIGGIELSFLNDLLFDHMTEDMSDKEREKALRARHLRENPGAIRYRHE